MMLGLANLFMCCGISVTMLLSKPSIRNVEVSYDCVLCAIYYTRHAQYYMGGREAVMDKGRDGWRKEVASACVTALIERNPRNVGNCGTIN